MNAPVDGQFRRKEDVENALKIQDMAKDVGYIKEEVIAIKHLVEDKYVTRIEFDPVKNLVYGMVGLILIAVLGGLIALIIKTR